MYGRQIRILIAQILLIHGFSLRSNADTTAHSDAESAGTTHETHVEQEQPASVEQPQAQKTPLVPKLATSISKEQLKQVACHTGASTTIYHSR